MGQDNMSGATFPKVAGTYALLFQVSMDLRVRVGRLGWLHLTPGVYVYVGSARGPGGLAARVGRHLQRTKTPHWHIDYITASLHPAAVIFTTDAEVGECDWVQQWLDGEGAFVPLAGLGSSDCRNHCPAHFIGLGEIKDISEVGRRLKSPIGVYVTEDGR